MAKGKATAVSNEILQATLQAMRNMMGDLYGENPELFMEHADAAELKLINAAEKGDAAFNKARLDIEAQYANDTGPGRPQPVIQGDPDAQTNTVGTSAVTQTDLEVEIDANPNLNERGKTQAKKLVQAHVSAGKQPGSLKKTDLWKSIETGTVVTDEQIAKTTKTALPLGKVGKTDRNLLKKAFEAAKDTENPERARKGLQTLQDMAQKGGAAGRGAEKLLSGMDKRKQISELEDLIPKPVKPPTPQERMATKLAGQAERAPKRAAYMEKLAQKAGSGNMLKEGLKALGYEGSIPLLGEVGDPAAERAAAEAALKTRESRLAALASGRGAQRAKNVKQLMNLRGQTEASIAGAKSVAPLTQSLERAGAGLAGAGKALTKVKGLKQAMQFGRGGMIGGGLAMLLPMLASLGQRGREAKSQRAEVQKQLPVMALQQMAQMMKQERLKREITRNPALLQLMEMQGQQAMQMAESSGAYGPPQVPGRSFI
jgi:hypothetical protein